MTYTLALTAGMLPTADVTLTLETTSTKSEVGLNCSVAPSTFTISAGSSANQTITILPNGNFVDEGTDEIAFTCLIKHHVDTVDAQYSTQVPRTLTINVVNDDHADVKMWTIDADDTYGYDVKFLSFYNLEGDSFRYGLRLDTEPTDTVRIEPKILLEDQTVVDPPVLIVNPPALYFGASNWSKHQILYFNSLSNNVDHDTEKFSVTHDISTDDTVMLAKSTARGMLASVTAADDDTAQVIVASRQALILQVNGDPKSITVKGLATKPIANVQIVAVVPFPTIQVWYPEQADSAFVSADEWNNVTLKITLKALVDTPSGTVQVLLQPMSTDPKYNTSASAVSVDLVIPEAGYEPSTNITMAPPQMSAWESATFQFYSADADSVGIEWKLDDNAYVLLPCAGGTHCTHHIPLLRKGDHRVLARAVTHLGIKDNSPEEHMWTIADCNDPRRFPLQYAEITEQNGALQCKDCPHHYGAECIVPGK